MNDEGEEEVGTESLWTAMQVWHLWQERRKRGGSGRKSLRLQHSLRNGWRRVPLLCSHWMVAVWGEVRPQREQGWIQRGSSGGFQSALYLPVEDKASTFHMSTCGRHVATTVQLLGLTDLSLHIGSGSSSFIVLRASLFEQKLRLGRLVRLTTFSITTFGTLTGIHPLPPRVAILNCPHSRFNHYLRILYNLTWRYGFNLHSWGIWALSNHTFLLLHMSIKVK